MKRPTPREACRNHSDYALYTFAGISIDGFVAGYLIRTKQIKPERLNPKTKKTARKKTTTKTPVAKKTASTKGKAS